jgi:hypothetical protein
MRVEDVVVVATVREEICRRNPLVDTAGIESLIEAAQIRVDASDDDSANSESGVADKEPPPTKEAASDEHLVSLCVVWLVNETESLTRHSVRNR